MWSCVGGAAWSVFSISMTISRKGNLGKNISKEEYLNSTVGSWGSDD